jgi:3-deoxy-manno-octulosonate cytidylyltransferase (CMP-KDO synthetase)
MKSIAILPARMGASRFPGKPLHLISGIPLIGHCYYRTMLATGIGATYVATCDEEIASYVRSIGGTAVMTSSAHSRASDRTAEAMLEIERFTGQEVEVVIMVQGDEPLIPPESISEILDKFSDPSVEIVNIMSRLQSQEAFEDKNNVKVVVDQNGDAMYFSREPIPSLWKGVNGVPMYQQVGVIAFRRNALIRFNETPKMPMENIESIDMNRVLETGGKIRMVMTDAVTIGVDTPDEACKVELFLEKDPIFGRYRKNERG